MNKQEQEIKELHELLAEREMRIKEMQNHIDSFKENGTNILRSICEPVVKYLQTRGNPHQTVVITQDKITLMSDEWGMNFRTVRGEARP